jgi:DNA replication protein DnaC
MKEQLIECCKQLRLSATLAENAMTATGATNQEYLLEVLKAEIQYRNMKRRNLYLKKAGFDNVKTFKGYDFEDITMPSIITVDLLKQAEFLSRQENLILYGKNGAGKSHMAIAIGVEACMQGKQVRFYKTAALVNELVAAKANGSLVRLLKKLSKLDLLICDEWGYIPFDAEGVPAAVPGNCRLL